jgi:CTP-dependent riboflavin kinase
MTHSFRGKIVQGPMAGETLIRKHEHRIVGLLGFKPFHGTMDVKLDKKLDMLPYSTKKLSHVMTHGREMIDLALAPVTVVFNNSIRYECWAAQNPRTPYMDIIELISAEKIMEKFDVKIGDEVEIIFSHHRPLKKKPISNFLNRLYGRQGQLTK